MRGKIQPLMSLVLMLMLTASITPLVASSESTVLSLESEVIEIPYLDKADGPTIVTVKLGISNVYNLRNATITLHYDSNILEPITGVMAKSFYFTVGGWSGSGFGNGLDPNSHYFQTHRSFSGSTIMFEYYFKVLAVGSTQINLADTLLFDATGSAIAHTVSGTTVKVVPFVTWADTKYAELKEKYDMLTADFQTLNITYQNLLSNYNKLTIDHNALSTDYASLELRRFTLDQHLQAQNATYHELKSNYEQLSSDYESLQAGYSTLETDYNQIVADNSKLKFDYESTTKESNTNANLMYIFMVTTIAFAVTTIYFAKRKTKTA